MNVSGKELSMKKPFCVLLILAAAVMLFASGYRIRTGLRKLEAVVDHFSKT